MAVKLIIPGIEVSPGPGETLFADDPEAAVRLTPRHAARLDVAVRGGAMRHEFDGADERDLVEIELEGNVKIWMSVSQLRDDLARGGLALPVRSSRDIHRLDGSLEIPGALTLGPRTRGLGGWVIKGLKLFGVDAVAPLADGLEAEIVRRFERKQIPEPGLYPCPEDVILDPTSAVKPGDLKSGGDPFLVFLHGTASSTLGSFGKLAPENRDKRREPTAEWSDLQRRYRGRIYALQHYTLSVSPVQNAIDLLTALPAGARLHLVSHSRGGLVGELLCRGSIDEKDLAPFDVPERQKDLALLRQLAALAREKKPVVERFVRVACPARGTVLVSRRLDLYLSVILNLFGLIPVLRESVLYDIVKATLTEVARRRMDPSRLPGLEAQMPTSPVINLLNRQNLTVAGELGVIAGDIQAGGGLKNSLLAFATDLFYRTQHDLVINTDSMYAGAARSRVFLFFDKGPEVNHFNYFSNPSSRKRLHAWLTKEGGDREGDLFAGPAPAPVRSVRATARALPPDAPVVFLLPDFLGATLEDAQGRIWPDLDALALGGLERLKHPRECVPGRLVADVYDDLITALGQKYRVKEFPCDGRRSAVEEGKRLAAAVKAELDGEGRRVSLVAHGQGGLVALGFMASDGGTWERLRAGGGRLVLLGSPLLGTAFAVRLLRGEEDLVRQLDLLDHGRTVRGIVEILAGWPGLLEVLPDQALNPDWWTQAPPPLSEKDLPAPAPDALAAARAARTQLLTALRERQPGEVAYIAGRASWTPTLLTQDEAGPPVWEGTFAGDGIVPYGLGPFAGIFAGIVEAPHGDLPRHAAAVPGLLELLEKGETRLLADLPDPGAPTEPPPVPPEEKPLLFPQEADLIAAALGSRLPVPETAGELVVHVAVVHGDLTQSSLPVAVGHYSGDTIVSAEKALDKELDGALSQRYLLNLYPGPRGTVEVVPSPGHTPPGALVIGLGELGEITPAVVTQGVSRAALRYALTVAERSAGSAEPQSWRSAAFSALLIGTGGGRSISIEESVAAIVRGALEANRLLRSRGFWDRVRIDKVELYELYESFAMRAVRAAKRLVVSLRLDPAENERLDVEPYLRRGKGGRFQPPVSQYDTGWWKRLQILEESPGELTFEVLTERARTERTRLGAQRALVDPMVAQASADPWYDAGTANTLFELLIPNELKEQAREETSLVLLLDEHTVHYPWELLTERSLEGADPLATCVGMIRQLRTEEREYRAVVRPPRDRFALVVGDPPSQFVELPGAQKEAATVKGLLLDSAFTVVPLIRRPADEIVRELFARDYQILHLAGHGQLDALHPERSGMVLGNGALLTSRELRQLRAVPPFVFVNCCFLGQIGERTQPRFHRFAASLALELIRMGVRALVVAGWAVHDHVAPVFASVLYDALLAGEKFGNAVLQARKAAFQRDRRSNTWGAYQCYGDPDFVLDLRGARTEEREEFPYVASRELVEALTDLRSEAQRADDPRLEKVRSRLERLAAALPADWRDGDVLSAFANVRRELGDWEKAIPEYGEALARWQSEARLKAVETLANLETRWADTLRRLPEGKEAAAGTPEELILRALAKIDALLALGKTPERLSLAGSARKRLALAASTSEKRLKALRRASALYEEAHLKALNDKHAIDPYPALNWIACRIALGEEDTSGEIVALITDAAKEGERLAASDPNVYHRLHRVDAALHRHLVEEDMKAHVDELVAEYQKVFSEGASFTDRSSVLEHLEFLAEMLLKVKSTKTRKAAAEALQRIQGQLAPTTASR